MRKENAAGTAGGGMVRKVVSLQSRAKFRRRWGIRVEKVPAGNALALWNLFDYCSLRAQQYATRCTETVKTPFRAAILGFSVTYATLHSQKTPRGIQPVHKNIFSLTHRQVMTGTEDAKVIAFHSGSDCGR